MLSEIVKKHQSEQAVRKKASETRRAEAVSAAQNVTKVMVQSLNEGVVIHIVLFYILCGHKVLVCGACSSSSTSSITYFVFVLVLAKAKVFSTQKQLEVEAKQLQSSLQKYTKLSNQWISMVENFNQALKVNTSRYFVMMYDNAISFSITVVRADYILVFMTCIVAIFVAFVHNHRTLGCTGLQHTVAFSHFLQEIYG